MAANTNARTSSNIYVLSEIENEKCCLGKEGEMPEAVREIP